MTNLLPLGSQKLKLVPIIFLSHFKTAELYQRLSWINKSNKSWSNSSWGIGGGPEAFTRRFVLASKRYNTFCLNGGSLCSQRRLAACKDCLENHLFGMGALVRSLCFCYRTLLKASAVSGFLCIAASSWRSLQRSLITRQEFSPLFWSRARANVSRRSTIKHASERFSLDTVMNAGCPHFRASSIDNILIQFLTSPPSFVNRFAFFTQFRKLLTKMLQLVGPSGGPKSKTNVKQ